MDLVDLKPRDKQLVYDLVTEAGVDTSNWSNFKGEHPSSNPKYCYDWAFWDDSKSKVVLCLWFSQMKKAGNTAYQELNYRSLASLSKHRDPSVGVRAKRAARMDQALFMAARRKLPVRVIVVDGSRRGEEGADFSEVERRMLDPIEWKVVSYDSETGECRLERGELPAVRSFLLTWGNFEETPDSEIESIATRLKRSKSVKGQWSSGNRKDIHVGERVFLLRQGVDDLGLVGWGLVSEEPFEDDHWDPVRRRAGVRANYIMVHWQEIVPKEDGVPRARLVELGIPETLLNAQGSGVMIPEDISTRLEAAWRDAFLLVGRSQPATAFDSSDDQSKRKLARIAYNSSGWQRPTGDAGELESGDTYNARNKFGHEDWLFRAEWVINGWRYAFIQGLNKHRLTYVGKPLDVTLYTIQPDNRRRLVATINGLESLNDDQARDALDAFKARGWLKIMQEEVKAIGGNASALGDPKWAQHVVNVRFRVDNVDLYPADTFLPEDEWIRDRKRYMLYKLEPDDETRIEQNVSGRKGSQDAPEIRRLFRKGTNPVVYTPEHDRMQAKLMAELQKEFGRSCVRREQDFIDVRVETEKELLYFEIKTDLDPRSVIRQALGQLLEYAYHPDRRGRRPDKLVIVGRTALGSNDAAYLDGLCERFRLPLSYRAVSI